MRFKLSQRKFDYLGLGLLGACLGCTQVVLDRGQIDDWFGSGFIAAFTVIAVVAFIAFILRELHTESPVVDLRLLGNMRFTLALIAMAMMGLIFYAANYLQPLFCQQMLGWTATLAGLALSPGAVVFVAMMPAMPWLIKRITPRIMVLVGFIVHGLACLIMAHWNLQLPFWSVLSSRILEIIGLAWLMVPINVMAFSFLSKEKITSGSGLLSLARNFGGSCGVSIAVTMLARRVQVHQAYLVQNVTPGTSAYEGALTAASRYLYQHGMSVADASTSAVALIGRRLQEQAGMLSYVDIYYLLALGSFLAAPIPLLIRGSGREPKRA